MKHITAPLQPGMYYHIYNRGNNLENLFLEKRNYPYFLTLYAKHIEPIADTYAYCLLRNHFHLSVTLIFYIHYNPQKHGFVDNFPDWEWSSYPALVGSGQTKLKRNEVLNIFDGIKGFEEFHQGRVDEKKLAALVDDEFESETSETYR